MSGTNTSGLTWVNSDTVSDLAKILLVSKKMIINPSNQQQINPLLNILNNELQANHNESPNVNCVKEIVALLTPEIQELLYTFHSI